MSHQKHRSKNQTTTLKSSNLYYIPLLLLIFFNQTFTEINCDSPIGVVEGIRDLSEASNDLRANKNVADDLKLKSLESDSQDLLKAEHHQQNDPNLRKDLIEPGSGHEVNPNLESKLKEASNDQPKRNGASAFLSRALQILKASFKKILGFFTHDITHHRPSGPPLFDFKHERELYKGQWHKTTHHYFSKRPPTLMESLPDQLVTVSNLGALLIKDEKEGIVIWEQLLREHNANQLQEDILKTKLFRGLAKVYRTQHEKAMEYQLREKEIAEELKSAIKKENWSMKGGFERRLKEVLVEIENAYIKYNKGLVALKDDPYYYKAPLSPLLHLSGKYTEKIFKNLAKKGILSGTDGKKSFTADVFKAASQEYRKHVELFNKMRGTEKAITHYIQQLATVPIDKKLMSKEVILEQFENLEPGKDINALVPKEENQFTKEMEEAMRQATEPDVRPEEEVEEETIDNRPGLQRSLTSPSLPPTTINQPQVEPKLIGSPRETHNHKKRNILAF